ncbi:MAG: hypothetical protein M3O64_04445 [Chloroflexota bacterium]|nr:hypothetical protein [Chloroflexota bacterium]
MRAFAIAGAVLLISCSAHVLAPGVRVRAGRTRDGRHAWSSGSGTLVIDPGGRSGTLKVDLPFAGWRRLPSIDASPAPTTTLPALHLEGPWVCPAGS